MSWVILHHKLSFYKLRTNHGFIEKESENFCVTKCFGTFIIAFLSFEQQCIKIKTAYIKNDVYV